MENMTQFKGISYDECCGLNSKSFFFNQFYHFNAPVAVAEEEEKEEEEEEENPEDWMV